MFDPNSVFFHIPPGLITSNTNELLCGRSSSILSVCCTPEFSHSPTQRLQVDYNHRSLTSVLIFGNKSQHMQSAIAILRYLITTSVLSELYLRVEAQGSHAVLLACSLQPALNGISVSTRPHGPFPKRNLLASAGIPYSFMQRSEPYLAVRDCSVG